MRYQLQKQTGFFFGLAYFACVLNMQAWMGIKGGRWWYCYPNYAVTLNDISAYFSGKALGRHQLIGLSPNKTLEGFLGAFFMNALFAYMGAAYFLQSDYWRCPPQHFNYGLFEPYQCENLSPIY